MNDKTKEDIIAFGIGFSIILFFILIVWLATTFKLISDILLILFGLFIISLFSWLLGSMLKDILRINGYELDTQYISEQAKNIRYAIRKTTHKIITKLTK
jgi:uncharacterized protein with PQ loop repeat